MTRQLPLPVIETPRLARRRLTTDDADFILELLNEPSFLRYIGDKGVRTREDAGRYILAGPMASYERFGFGLYRVERKDGGEPIGICGLLKRDSLEDVDVGFAFLPRAWSKPCVMPASMRESASGRFSSSRPRASSASIAANSFSMARADGAPSVSLRWMVSASSSRTRS